MNKVHSVRFCFNEEDNGGESLTLHVDYFDNGDGKLGLPDGVLMNQKLTLMSYGNSASFDFSCSPFEPDQLRKLADIIERGRKEAFEKVVK